MKRLMLFAPVAVLIVAAASSATAYAAGNTARFYNRSDAWAWVTEYHNAGSGVVRAYCVNPHSETSVVGTSITVVPRAGAAFETGIYEVRVEVKEKNCGGKLMLDRTLGYDGRTPYYVTGSDGKYRFGHTP